MSNTNQTPTLALTLNAGAISTGIIVEKAIIREALSEIYNCDIWFCCTTAIRAENVVGKQAKLTIDVSGMSTVFQGLLFSFEFVGRNHVSRSIQPTGKYLYRATISPKLRLLELDSQNAVFGSDGALDVIELIGKKLSPDNVSRDVAGLSTNYPKADFVVQFNESNLNFIRRQCEHQGISFYHRINNDDEICVFADKTACYDRLDRGSLRSDAPQIFSGKGTDAITFNSGAALNAVNYPVVSDFGFRASAVSQKVTVAEYSPPTPSTAATQTSSVKVGETTVGLSGTRVEYGTVLREQNGAANNGVDRFALMRAEGVAARQKVFFATSNCPSLRAGKRFTLIGHPDHNDEYLVVAVMQEVCTPIDGSEGHPNLTPSSFQARVECIPASVTFRPALMTPKPQAAGVFTAFVDSSTDGKEADLDGEGRYRLQFHYDQVSKTAGKRSGLVRKMQPYAGPDGTGMHFPLLKGSEVVVACINGDVDRPMIMGAVPNRDNPNIVFTEGDETKKAAQEMPSQTMNRIRTPSGAMLEINDRAAGTTAAPQLRLAAPTSKALQESGSYLRLGTYSSKESALLTGLKTYTSTVTFTGKTEPVADLLTAEEKLEALLTGGMQGLTDALDDQKTYQEAAQEANEDKKKGGASEAEAVTTNAGEAEAPASEAVDSTVNPPKVKDGYVLKPGTTDVYTRPGYTAKEGAPGSYFRPGFSADNTFEDTSVTPPVILYVRRGFSVQNGQIVASKIGQRELLSISAKMTEDAGYTPNTGGILLKSDKHLDVNIAGGTTALFGRGVTQQITAGDLKLTVPAGLVSINAANGIMLEAGTAAKPANINFLAYGYVKQEAKGPVSDYFYSTQERKVYGYSKEWFYGEKYSEFHGFEEKKFYGSSKSHTEGSTESTFIGSKTSTTFSSDTAFKMGVESKINISQINQIKIANEYSLNASAKAQFVLGAAFVLGASVKLEILLGAEMKITLWTFKIVSIDFKYVSGLDSKVSNVVVEHKSFQLANKPAEYKIGMSEGKLGAIQNYIAAKIAL